MKYKKRGIVIEAIKWSGENVQEILDFTEQKVKPRHFNPIQISTDWGVMECKVGDMVMRGINGEFYSCDADVFPMSYEAVEGRKYRKLPVIIEAEQLTLDNWVNVAKFVPKDVLNKLVVQDNDISLELKTLEGNLKASVGDWIIRGVKGEYYYNSPETFEKTYEKFDDEYKWTSGKEILKVRVD